MCKKQNQGFTLIELIGVTALVALISGFAITKLSVVSGMKLRSTASQIAGFLQMSHQHAVLTHQRVRVFYDFTEKQLWASTYQEAQPTALLTDSSNLDDAMMTFTKQSENAEELLAESPEKNFTKISSGKIKPEKIPSPFEIKGFFTSTLPEKKTEGLVWIDFLPNGVSSFAAIYLTQGKRVYTIILRPLGGSTRLENKEVTPEEAQKL